MTPYLIVGFLTVVAIGLATLGVRQWRPHRSAVLIALAAGLGVIIVTITSIWPALTDESQQAEQSRLRRQLTEVVRERDVSFVHLPLGWDGKLWDFCHPLDFLGSDGGGGVGGGPGISVGAALALKGSGRVAVCVGGAAD